MSLSNIIIVRHATRIDSINPNWSKTSPCPYDPPLAEKGFIESIQTGESISNHISTNERVIIHCSPFLRCVQTAVSIANKLNNPSTQIRLDATFGEWQCTDYFSDISPPPPDGHKSIAENASTWYYLNHMNKINTQNHNLLDTNWPLQKFGSGGDYGESWSSMHNRFNNGITKLVEYYDQEAKSATTDDNNVTIIVVTHGAGCNSLLGLLSNLPLLSKISLASYAIAHRSSPDTFKWSIIYNSNKSPTPQSDDETTTPSSHHHHPPLLSSSNSTSYSSISDMNDEDFAADPITASQHTPTYPDYQSNWFTPTSSIPTLSNIVFDLGNARPATPLHQRNTSTDEEPILLSFGGFAPSSNPTSKSSLHSSPSLTPTRT